jgi:hypothetical protein
VVLLGSSHEVAGEEVHLVQGYGLVVPAVRRPCDPQKTLAVPQIESY